MINRIIDFSVNNKVIIFLLTAAACLLGWWSMKSLTLDAIPDLSDTQVIIYSRWDRSPDIIEDQVTYPIVSAMTGAPRVKAVRGFSDFGYSYVVPVDCMVSPFCQPSATATSYPNMPSARMPATESLG